jgi:2-polyprenyl-3-methyl-5-hydroxy-6-metoxy-1,4-benzoquinol methylase
MEGLNVYAIDASPSFVEAFRRNLPGIPVKCEAVEDSTFFDRTFDGVLAWGLIFLLSVKEQRRLIQRAADMLAPGSYRSSAIGSHSRYFTVSSTKFRASFRQTSSGSHTYRTSRVLRRSTCSRSQR